MASRAVGLRGSMHLLSIRGSLLEEEQEIRKASWREKARRPGWREINREEVRALAAPLSERERGRETQGQKNWSDGDGGGGKRPARREENEES